MVKKITIIGNAPLSWNFFRVIRLIDSSDIVIRMNLCNNLGRKTGSKIDILGLINRGTPANDLVSKNTKLENKIKQQLKEIWFSRPSREWEFDTENVKQYHLPNDVSEEVLIAQELSKTNASIRYLSVMGFRHLLGIVNGNNVYRYEPSTGLSIIHMLLSDSLYTSFDKYLIGFTWQGWHGHNWKAEKDYLHSLQDSGVINLKYN